MEVLDVDGGFDVHRYRHGLKLLTQGEATMHLENREGFGCPACGEVFDRLFVSKKRHNTFSSPPGPFCLTRAEGQVLLCTH